MCSSSIFISRCIVVRRRCQTTKIYYLLNLLHIYKYRFHIRAVSSIFPLRRWLFRGPWSQKDTGVSGVAAWKIDSSFNSSLVAHGTIYSDTANGFFGIIMKTSRYESRNSWWIDESPSMSSFYWETFSCDIYDLYMYLMSSLSIIYKNRLTKQIENTIY